MKLTGFSIKFKDSPFDREVLKALEILRDYAMEEGISQKKVIGDAIIYYANLIKGGEYEKKTGLEAKE